MRMYGRDNPFRWAAMALAVFVVGCCGFSSAWGGNGVNRQWVDKQVASIFKQLRMTEDFDAARQSTVELFDQVIGYASLDDPESFRQAGYVVRLIEQLSQVETDKRMIMFEMLADNDKLARTLVFLVKDDDNSEKVYRVLNKLHKQHGASINEYANLAAAICVVHDKRVVHRINENMTTAAQPGDIFKYYRDNDTNMMFGVKKVPPRLLVYVVDNAVSIDQMQWALRKYAFNRRVGSLFFNIKYDQGHLRDGKVKRVTQKGWSLENILRYGGVCVDQAYFAVAVGKSIGVPAVYTTGRSAGAAHAWVGYLQVNNNRARWNFNDGRYGVYKGLKGIVNDPQTGQWVADSYVSLLAEMNSTSPVDRQSATAIFDAAQRLLQLQKNNLALHVKPVADGQTIKRSATSNDIEDIIEAGLRLCVGDARGWLLIAEIAESKDFSIEKKQLWAARVQKLCAEKYPDFALAILQPLVESVDDDNLQNIMWQRAFETFEHRRDLAAEIRLAQGRMWHKAGETVHAGRCYEDIIERFANESPIILQALDELERLLSEMGRSDQIVDIYKNAWRKIKQPGTLSNNFFIQSNWYAVGMRLVEALENAGRVQEAKKLHRRIEVAGKLELKVN